MAGASSLLPMSTDFSRQGYRASAKRDFASSDVDDLVPSSPPPEYNLPSTNLPYITGRRRGSQAVYSPFPSSSMADMLSSDATTVNTKEGSNELKALANLYDMNRFAGGWGVARHPESEAEDNIDGSSRARRRIMTDGELGYIATKTAQEFYIDPAQQVIKKIDEALLREELTVDLSDMGLKTLPDQIADLQLLVVTAGPEVLTPLTPPTLALYLSQNALSLLPKAVFHVSNLTVLSLRQNRLTKLPGCIKNLVNLKELSVGRNFLTSLPASILDMKNLKVLNAIPNPFIEPSCPPPPTPPPSIDTTANCQPVLIERDTRIYPSFVGRCNGNANTLVEYCLRSLVLTDNVAKLSKRYALPPNLEARVNKAFRRALMDERCDTCNVLLCESIGYNLEFWQGVGGSGVLCFKRHGCRVACMA